METTASDASTHGEGAEPAALLLAYGTAVRIQDGGSEQGGVCLNQTRLDVFVRLEDGRIRSYSLRKVRRAGHDASRADRRIPGRAFLAVMRRRRHQTQNVEDADGEYREVDHDEGD